MSAFSDHAVLPGPNIQTVTWGAKIFNRHGLPAFASLARVADEFRRDPADSRRLGASGFARRGGHGTTNPGWRVNLQQTG